jgi:hypothetical protein
MTILWRRKLAFFVVVDRMGVHVYEYANTDEIQLKPGEVLVGRTDMLEEAERIEAETDPLSVRPSIES